MNILQCPACSLLLVRPYTLRCGHTVCGEHPQTRCPVQQCSFSPQVSAPHLPISPRVAYFPAPQGPPPEESSTSSHSIQGTDVTATRVIHSVRQLEHSDAPEPPRPRKRRKHDPEEVHTDNEEEDLLSHLQVQNALQKTTQPDTPLLSPDLAHPPDAYKTRCERDLLANLTCGICLTLLYRPITTPCQHTFCTKCLHRSLDHSPNCPVCRQELPGFAYFQDAPVNSFLLRILKYYFNDQYAARAKTIEDEERDGRLNTPIFVCQLSYPGMPTLLHFFEPRYRLMLRRCLESENPSFGMIMPPSPTGPYTSGQPPTLADANYGTMLEIRSVQMLSDGRSMVETWGTHRFRILERGILDGYTVGRIERIDDMEDIPVDLITSDPQPSSADSSSTEKDSSARKSEEPHLLASVLANNERVRTKEELVKICLDFLSRLRASAGTAPWVVQRLNNTFGPMPSPETDLAGFTFWVGMAIPVDDREKAKLLPIRSPRLRLRLCVHWIERLDGNWWVYLSLSSLFYAPSRGVDWLWNILFGRFGLSPSEVSSSPTFLFLLTTLFAYWFLQVVLKWMRDFVNRLGRFPLDTIMISLPIGMLVACIFDLMGTCWNISHPLA